MTGVSMPPLAQLAHDVEAAEARQHDVEQHQIERFGGGALEAALAVAARFDGISLARQPIGERHDETGLVFDEQQPLHEWSSSLSLDARVGRRLGGTQASATRRGAAR